MNVDHLKENDPHAEAHAIAVAEGRVAVAEGRAHADNPHKWPAEWRAHVAWSHGYFLATIEAKFAIRLEVKAPPLADLTFDQDTPHAP